MSAIVNTEEDVRIHENTIATETTRYILALIRQQELREKLRGYSKKQIIDYVIRCGIDIEIPRLRNMTKLNLVENAVEFCVNRIDFAEKLEGMGITTDDLDILVNLYLDRRGEV